ncbi:MAG: hypothetical protein M1818_002201 [Claussenomyces sp. TS43310]|nr:MAG: hypothetical protein M1818_002201 [Claussenomyces sp. TS43310]
MLLYLLGLFILPLAAADHLSRRGSVGTINGTVSNALLQTWWHNTGEINSQTAVADGNVRQSHMYSVQVATAGNASDEVYYNSFVYETIPRNGNGNIGIPNDPSSVSTDDDGITIESTIDMTMAWTSFLYSEDVSIMISRLDGTNVTASDVVIRPSTLDFEVSDFDGNIYITVPYNSNGIRFSVEFSENLWQFRDSCDTPVCDFVQDVVPDGSDYVSSYSADNALMGIEPLDSLLIFASPFETSDMVPDATSSSSLVVEEGLVTGLNETDATTVIFNPGVYYLTSTAHALLNSGVDWVYLAPGAYVKGAMQFQTDAAVIKATGHGVLSGEQYVYQANPTVGYSNSKSNEDSLRMWMGYSSYSVQQTFVIDGLTTNAPPFNSVDFQGDLDTISIQGSDYKQVGAFFGQTDGMTLYPNSSIHDIFYHSNDDTIKTYYSNIDVQRITVWKAHTAPTIQFGWASRNLDNIVINDIDIIHSRYSSNGSHPSIIGANQVYNHSEDETVTANLANTVQGITISNIRAEGISGALFRICPLANFDNFLIENVTIDEFPVETTAIKDSELPMFTDDTGNQVSMSGFVIKNYYVNGTKISFDANNWGINDLGGLNIASPFLQSGGLTIQ